MLRKWPRIRYLIIMTFIVSVFTLLMMNYKNLVTLGLLFELKDDMTVLFDDYKHAETIYSTTPREEAVKEIAATNTAGGYLYLSKQDPISECFYKESAIKLINNPAIGDALLRSSSFSDDKCDMNKDWYANILQYAQNHELNSLRILREFGYSHEVRKIDIIFEKELGIEVKQ